MDNNQEPKAQRAQGVYGAYRNIQAASQASRIAQGILKKLAVQASQRLAVTFTSLVAGAGPFGVAIAIAIGLVVLLTFFIVFSAPAL